MANGFEDDKKPKQEVKAEGVDVEQQVEVPTAVLAKKLEGAVEEAGDEALRLAQTEVGDLGLADNTEVVAAEGVFEAGILSAEQVAEGEMEAAAAEGGRDKGKERSQEFRLAVTSGDYGKMVEALFSAEGGIKPEDFYQTLIKQVGKVRSGDKETFLDTSGHTESLIIDIERNARKDEVMGSGKDKKHDLRLNGTEYNEREEKATLALDSLKKEDLVDAVSRCLEKGEKELSNLAVADILGDEKMMQAIEDKVPGFKEQVMTIISKPEFQAILQANIDELRGKVEYLSDEFDGAFNEHQRLESAYNEGVSVVDPQYNAYNGGAVRTGRAGGETMLDEDKKATGIKMINNVHRYIGAHLDVRNHSDQVTRLERFLVKKPAAEAANAVSA